MPLGPENQFCLTFACMVIRKKLEIINYFAPLEEHKWPEEILNTSLPTYSNYQ